MKKEDGETPLIRASYYGKLGVARLFVKYGANINAQDHQGMTPLHTASYQGHENVVRYLIEEAKADLTIKTKTHEGPLYLAILEGSAPVVAVLIKNGANVNEKGEDGASLLHNAATTMKFATATVAKNLLEIIKLLVNNGADVNAKFVPFPAVSDVEFSPLSNLEGAISPEGKEAATFLRNRGARQ